MSKLIIGCGYVGRRLAVEWRDQGEQVWVTTRRKRHAEEFQALGLSPILLDVTADIMEPLPPVETVVFAVGFDRSSASGIRDVYVEGLRRIVEYCPASVKRFIYISSTGVYGQSAGEWVDEQTLCQPVRDGGIACLAAENLLRNDPSWQDRVIILRLAGIYGPERVPHMAKILNNEPLPVAAEGYLNLIHVDDVVQIICRADRELDPPALLCVADGQPVQRRAFYAFLAGLLGPEQRGREKPSFAAPKPGSTQAERARGSKKIRNDRLVQLLNPDWRYPNYEAGLEAIVAGSD